MAEIIKCEKNEGFEHANFLKQQEQLRNASMKQMIKNQEMELVDKKRKDEQERKARGRQELCRKILEENQRRINIEMEVARMEQEELELIQRLQNTQMLQKAAYDDLEGALSNGSRMSNQLNQNVY